MKFLVCRTSELDIEKSPCEEAMECSLICEVDNIMIKRWYIEINTLEELVDFCKKHRSLVIEPYTWNKSYMIIEIYDTFRE